MCPLRLILIFLSASLAGFFMLRGLRVQPEEEIKNAGGKVAGGEESLPLSDKVRSAISLGFWTCVDMASGRYLWRNLVAPVTADAGKKI
ncbi:hypothetical protein KSP40_PGU001946 [Platanthera guangdongensis]|uniref:Uncharacterized protein n=1 Tax=Platanthera guangdongensis TaxID=2320717 RepID=A0ABR2M1H4_9ASPA